ASLAENQVAVETAPAPSAPEKTGEQLLTATAIGKHFSLPANKCNYIFSELGWLNKGLKGWLVTKPGERQGGQQSEDYRSGVPYVRWPASILENKTGSSDLSVRECLWPSHPCANYPEPPMYAGSGLCW